MRPRAVARLALCLLLAASCSPRVTERVAVASSAPADTPLETQAVATAESTAPAPTARQRTPTGPSRTPGIRITPTPVPPVGNSPVLGGCPVFPDDNEWNREISNDPVHARSSEYIASISASRGFLHPDFGSNPEYGIPFTVVPREQARVPIRFTEYPDESDDGPYPVPPDAPVEAGDDRHVLVLQSGNCMLYELYHAEKRSDGWDAGCGAIYDLRSNRLRPDGWTSADAAGLPILAGLARYDEIAAGQIRHALRFTVQRTQRAYIHPATHFASSDTDGRLPPMGLRLRLKSSFDITAYRGHARVILEALQRYGMLVADNGSSWFISGATDPRWDDADLEQLKSVPGSAFEAVQTGPIRT